MYSISQIAHTFFRPNSFNIKRGRIRLICSAISLLISYTPISALAESNTNKLESNSLASKELEQKYYYSNNIIFRDEDFQRAVKLFRWLDLIKLTEIGHSTLKAIENSSHKLIFYHSDSVINSAGKTGAPLTKNLTNGNGENAYIKFYFDMSLQGSNCVLGQNGHYIEYTALHNLFHELSHARHKMNGTWLYFDSEGQAIREENKFRYEWSQYRYEKYSLRDEDIENEEVTLRVSDKCLAYHMADH